MLMEHDKEFLPVRRHHREFRFDLSRIPEGEAVTAAEFRIYKDFRLENENAPLSLPPSPKSEPSGRGMAGLVFDVTATSNHWVLNPDKNLGLQLALDTTS
ncbi:hypothetical protein CRUP_022520, partial [Coryphaenoides rupestris]